MCYFSNEHKSIYATAFSCIVPLFFFHSLSLLLPLSFEVSFSLSFFLSPRSTCILFAKEASAHSSVVYCGVMCIKTLGACATFAMANWCVNISFHPMVNSCIFPLHSFHNLYPYLSGRFFSLLVFHSLQFLLFLVSTAILLARANIHKRTILFD